MSKDLKPMHSSDGYGLNWKRKNNLYDMKVTLNIITTGLLKIIWHSFPGETQINRLNKIKNKFLRIEKLQHIVIQI